MTQDFSELPPNLLVPVNNGASDRSNDFLFTYSTEGVFYNVNRSC
jgi:hypothetical protein